MDLRHALDWLDRHTNYEGSAPDGSPAVVLPNAGDTAGLSLAAIEQLLAALGDPHRSYRIIHITGTNGKGSTARFASAILATTGLSVGTYTSPNLSRVNERIVWDGQTIPDLELARVLTLIAEIEPLLAESLTRFEILTAAAFTWFAEMGAEVAVVEVGLLGRFDATNVVTADVAVITNIGKDHTDGAPGWAEQIAWEKAGIIEPEGCVVLGSPMGDLRPIFDAEPSFATYEAGTDFHLDANLVAVGGRSIDLRTPQSLLEDLHVPFHGAHQGQNLATAVMAVEAFFDRPVAQELVEDALASVELPGRFEIVGHHPMVVLDGAHNPHGAAAARRTLDDEFARLGSWVLVFGMLSGRDPAEMLEALGAREFDAVIITEPRWSRAVPAATIAAAAASIGVEVEVVPDAIAAFERARAVTNDDDLILVSGSLSLIGQLRSYAVAAGTE